MKKTNEFKDNEGEYILMNIDEIKYHLKTIRYYLIDEYKIKFNDLMKQQIENAWRII